MKTLFEGLDSHFPPHRPISDWRNAVGPDAIPVLEKAGILLRSPIVAGNRFPCPNQPGPGCPRHVTHTYRGTLHAVCGGSGQCDPVELPPEDAWFLEVEPQAFLQALTHLLKVQPVPLELKYGRPVPLGVRRFGPRRVVFAWCHTAAIPDIGVYLDSMQRIWTGTLIALVLPRGSSLSPSYRAEIKLREAAWLSLEDSLLWAGGRVRIALAEFLLDNHLELNEQASELWPERWLVLDPRNGHYLFAGEWLALPANGLHARLLETLAGAPNTTITLLQVVRALWPGDIPSSGKARRGIVQARDNQIRVLMRYLRTELGRAARAAESGPRLGAEVLETVRSEDEDQRGFLLRLPPGRVHWCSSRPEGMPD